jgi:hypothetical protein
MRQKPHIPLLVYFAFSLFFVGTQNPIVPKISYSADTATLNLTNALGVGGTLLASPPASCTGVPNGFNGDCGTRGSAAVNAWVNGNFASGTNWNEIENASVSATIDRTTLLAIPPPSLKAPTDIGTSWIPEYCNQPSCGHLLKGDVIFVDENGDGVFDDTWYDDDNDNVREAGEVDRLRADQFGWGATSTILDFTKIGGPTKLQIVQGSGVTPPGLSRARVRVALGPDWDCVMVTNQNCVLDGIVEAQGSDPTTTIDDNEFYGTCDPDQWFNLGDDLITIQRKLDNCLWETGSFPTTAPLNAEVTGVGNAIRTNWIDQRIVKYTASTTPDRQAFTQSWLAHYGFDHSDPIEEALYLNGMVLDQTDVDPNPLNNLTGTMDTYDSTFRLFHTSIGRKNSAGLTNPTVDPFWNVDSTEGYGVDMNTHADSGVGKANGFKFLYVQNVEGSSVTSCLGCGPGHDVSIPGEVNFDQIFPLIPAIQIGSHPPAFSEQFNIIPAP